MYVDKIVFILIIFFFYWSMNVKKVINFKLKVIIFLLLLKSKSRKIHGGLNKVNTFSPNLSINKIYSHNNSICERNK